MTNFTYPGFWSIITTVTERALNPQITRFFVSERNATIIADHAPSSARVLFRDKSSELHQMGLFNFNHILGKQKTPVATGADALLNHTLQGGVI